MSLFRRITRRLSFIALGWLKFAPFSPAMRLRNRLYRRVLNHMGPNCNITDAVTITSPENVSLGERVSIHEYSVLGGSGDIVIGDRVAIANSCTLISESHIFSDPNKPIKEQGLTAQPITIGDDVWLGARVTVLGNVTIGPGAVIGAGSVVSRDIPANAIAVGVPCRVIGQRGESSEGTKQ